MTDERTGMTRDYSGKKAELVHAEISLPEDAPDWAVNRYGGEDVDAAAERLWNDIEIREDQHNRHASAQLALNHTIALPVELSHEQSIALMRDFVQTSLVSSGATADWVIHDKGDGNPHVHVMTTLRTLGNTGLDQKIRTYQDRRQDIVNLRFNWACAANSALEAAGFEARIDHRRLDAQGIELGAISFNAEVAANIEQGDAAYRVKQRVMEARLENEVYLMANPEHMLTVVAASSPLFTEADLERGFQQYLPTSVGRQGIADLMRRAMSSADLVSLERRSSRDEPFLTTRAVVEMNRQMERDALSLAHSTLVLDPDQGREALSEALSDEQGRAVRAMLSPRRLSLVTGYAGAGKTFAVKEASKVWAARGFEVLGGAISGKAAQELRGIEGQVATLAQWEARWDRGERPAQGRFVFVMDEAGMVGTAIWSRMQARIEAMGGKLIALGDAAQLAPIQDTAAFKHLTKLVGQVTIGEVRRQEDAGDRRATEMLSRGGAEAARAIDHYAQKGAIRFEGSLGVAIDALSKAYFEDEGVERIALTHRNADVDALNGAIRIEALARGVVDHKSQVSYERGKGVDPLGWQGISCPRNPLVLGIGDRVRFTRPFREGSVTKSSFASVLAASETQLVLSVDGRDGIVTVDPRAFLHFDYGYAATVHKSQGMTMNAVYVLLTEQFDGHLLDVSLSRHVQGLRVWVPEDQVEDVAGIKEMVLRSSLIDVVRGREGDAPVLGRITRDISDVAVGQRLDRIAPEVNLAVEAALPRQGPGVADPADPFESGTGPILIDLPVEERTGNARAHPERGAGVGGQNRFAAQKTGPSVANVREALNVWTEDLFRASFGEPVAARSAEWRARESGAIAMKMRGPSRGLWTDHRSGEGGDLLDLVARSFCGLNAARDDFPKVMQEAIRFTGLSSAAVDDLAALATRRQARIHAATADEAREDARKAALVTSLAGDAHLTQQGMRMAGLLRAEYEPDQADLADDPRGYATDPLKLVDDLLAEQGVFRASDVAARMAQVVNAPDLFMRLYMQAMSHPDLVVLSEEGLRGEGRVYSSTTRVAQVAGLMDRGVALAVGQGFEAVEPSLVEASAQNAGLSDAGRAGLEYALWPSRIGILEEIGTGETARVVQALGEVAHGTDRNAGSDAQVIAVSPDARAAKRFAAATATAAATTTAAPGIEGMGLYTFGNRLRQGSLALRAQDILVVPEASGLHVDDLDLLMGFAEDSGAKLLLHSDPSLEAPGAVVRHLSARIEVSVLGGFEALAADRRALVEGGQALEATYNAFWNKDVFTGSGNNEEQVDAYVAGFVADETVDKLGVASSARMRDALNIRIEAELLKEKGSSAGQVHRIARGEAPELAVHEGSVLVLRRDSAAHGLTAGVRGEVVAVDAAGQVTVRFEVQDVTFTPGAQAAGLDYGYVLSAREAHGVATDSLHGFAGRGLRRPDLITMLGAGERFSLSLPVDPDSEGAAFIARALAREGRGSVLDYGFDPGRALAAAAASVQDTAASPPPDPLLSAAELAVRARTAAQLQAQPAFIVSALVRARGRFDQGQLLGHVQTLFPAVEYPDFDHKALADRVLAETLKQGALIEAGTSRLDGAPLYTTRVQAEIDARALSEGKALARSRLEGIDPADMAALPDDVAHVAGAERLSLASVDPGPGRDAFLRATGAIWRDRGYQVIATSMSGVIAEALAARLGAGANAAVHHGSLASLEAQWAMGRLPEDRFVVVLEGAERVQSAQWMRVQARIAQMGGKLIAVDHSSALSPIGSVSLYRLLAREVGIEARGGIAHQVREDERIATSYLSQPALGSQSGAPAVQALDIYNDKGAVHFAGRVEGAQASLARAYWADDYQQEVEPDGEVRLAMAHARAMAGTLDAAIRAEGQRLGRLGDGETCWGRRVNIGEVLAAKSDIALAQVKAGDRGRVVKLGPESIELEMPGHRETVEIYTSARMAQFASSMATTIHDAESRVVDRSYLYASRGMDQEMFRVGMTRHWQSLDLHVPETAFRDYEALQKAVQRNNDLEMLAAVSPDEMAREVIIAPGISDRADRTGAALWSGGDFGMDAHLQATASRIAGLMAIDYRRGAPVLGEDPRGYARDPLKLVDDLLAQRSVIRASDVARSLSGVLRDPDSFVRLFAEAMAHPDLVVLSEEGLRGEGRVYSTLAHIRRELDLVDKVSALALAQSDIDPTTARLKAAARTEHGAMSPDQERALRHATSPARVAMIAGVAGSGKSSVLNGVREVYEREGWNVIGAAMAGKAAQGLQDASGIQSTTLAALGFAAVQDRVTLGPKSLLVVDEAGMLNAEHFEMVLDLVERTGASLRLVGDPRQLQPRGPGAMWRAFADRIGTVDLTTVWRQRDPEDREATRNLAAGGARADLAIDHFLSKGVVHATGTGPNGGTDPNDPNAGTDRDALLRAAVAGYSADPHEDKMLLTYRLADVADMNRMARADDQARRSDDLPRIAVGKSGGDVLELQAGDRIAFRENRRLLGIVNGMTGKIAAVNAEKQSFTVRIGTDKDEARYITLKAEDAPALDYGYATTLHKSQGGTHASSHLVATTGFDHPLFYVGATRYSSALAIYAPVEEDKVEAYLKTIARREPALTTTLEAAYGFDPAKGFEAARQARAEGGVGDRTEAKARAEEDDLGAYVARHNGVPRSVSMPLGPLSRLFAPTPEREALAPGADTRALSDVIGAHILGHGRQMEAQVQARVTRLLQDVSTATWGKMCKTLPRDLPARAEVVATRWTDSQPGDDLLPEARAFGRAIAIADRHGGSAVARPLKSGLELLSARVTQARGEGSYDQMLAVANAPASEVSSQDMLARAQPITTREWRGPQRHVAPVRSSGVRLGGGLDSMGELAVAAQVIRSLSSKGPGFWDTLLSDYGDHRKSQTAMAGADIASKEKKDMEQSLGMKLTPGIDPEALTPITEGHQKVLARVLNPDANRELTEGIALGDYAGQIGAGTMKFGDMEKTANAFRQHAVQAGSIGPCDPSVPAAWQARLLDAVKFGAAFEKMPKVESVEEWSWALSHSLRIGALATGPEDLTRAQAGVVPSWADRVAATMIADIKHRPDDKSTMESMDWDINLRGYVSQVTYVPFKNVYSSALDLAQSDPAVIAEKLAGEPVPQEWKDRLTTRLSNRNDYLKQPKFASLAESEWAISTMVTKGAEVSMGRTPTPNDLVKAVMEEKGPSMSMRPF